MKSAVCLLSGGMDSAVAAAIASSEGYAVHGLFIDYGQRTLTKELDCAKKLASALNLKSLKILDLKFLKEIGGSALTDEKIKVPTNVDLDDKETIRCTYVPFRNTILWSLATAFAEVVNADAIFNGSNPECVHPDNTVEYLSAMQTVVYLGTNKTTYIKLRTPIQDMDKSDIVNKGRELNVPFELTWSCYNNTESACGVCESCERRLAGFKALGLTDNIPYVK
jgi:7-cyano-7-deazaguanine synthase